MKNRFWMLSLLALALLLCLAHGAWAKTYGAFEVVATDGGELREGNCEWNAGGVYLYIRTDKPMTISMAEGKGSSEARIEVAKNISANLTLKDVKINTTSGPALKIADDSSGAVSITLVGENELISTHVYSAGLQKSGTSGTLTIGGAGSLTAHGGERGAGIGGRKDGIASEITITSGQITAQGGAEGAGIGGGALAIATNITISGGTVRAIGGTKGDGIGRGKGDAGSAKYITVTGGSVYASAGSGYSAIGTIPKNGASRNLSLYKIQLVDISDKPVSSTRVMGIKNGSDPIDYGLNGVRTDADGYLYLYLPEDVYLNNVLNEDKLFSGTVLRILLACTQERLRSKTS